ncbi:MAG: peptidylprolyl isomerase [Candidatus Zixiibacteriota bacterium]
MALIVLVAVGAYYFYDKNRVRGQSEKLAQIIHDEDRREFSARLKGYLADPNVEIRRRAALAVGRIGDKRGSELLYTLVMDSSLDVAGAAAFALGLMQDRRYASKLIEVAIDLPGAVAASAVEAAGRLTDSSMTEMPDRIARFLEDPSPEVREAACNALFLCRAKSKAAELVSLASTETDSLVKERALYALARMGAPEGERIYVESLADADPAVRAWAVRGLGAVSSPEAEHYLAIALNDIDAGVEAQAINALASKASSQTAGHLARKLGTVYDEKIVVEIFNALQKLKSDQAQLSAETILFTEPSDNVAAAAIKYLAAIQGDRAVNLVDSILTRKPSPIIRDACVEAYGLMNQPSVVSRVAVYFGDEEPSVRNAALDVLAKLDMNNLDFHINKALVDPDFSVVVNGIEKIKEQKLTSFLPTLKNLMAKGTSINPDIRRSIIEALPVFFNTLGQDSAVVRLLIDGILDKEYVVRLAAAKVYDDVRQEDRYKQVPPSTTRIAEADIRKAFDRFAMLNPSATIITSKGPIELELLFDVTPLTVLNFMSLAKTGFYNGLIFHRVVPGFVIQGGDPRGDGWGGPDYYIRDEYSEHPYERGTVGIATSGKDTGGSQFFITVAPQPHLNARYTVFGEVLTGMDIADQIVPGDTIQKIIIREGKT